MNRDELLQTIELKRKQLIDAALLFGFTHEKTIKYSQELDEWLNLLESLS
jgi:stage 0 sporulation regulatory protein